MCIKLHWDEQDNRLLHMTFEDNWTLQAYYHSITALECMTEIRDEPVTVMMDMREAVMMAAHVPHGRRVDEASAMANVERVVLICPGHFMPQVTCDVITVDSIESAYEAVYDTLSA